MVLIFVVYFFKRKKEVWIDYNGLPICFGINEFATMTGLRCHSLLPLSQQLAKIEKESEILVDEEGEICYYDWTSVNSCSKFAIVI